MYRRRRALSRLWLLSDPGVVSCNNITTSFGVFRKRRQPKVFHVGLGKQFLTIKSALDKASRYGKNNSASWSLSGLINALPQISSCYFGN